MSTLYRYIAGYAISLILTFFAFVLAAQHLLTGHIFLPHSIVVPMLIVLALTQLFVQLVLFLHLGKEAKPRWNLLAFIFAILVVTILVGGTLWIMQNLARGHAESAQPFIEGEVTPQTER